jgi:TfoX/Sxy family transcriptional regulator of competence genes
MPKPDPKALKAFEALVKDAPGARVKPMFGNFGAFANGQMFAGVFGAAVLVRLSEQDRAEALKLQGAELFAPMKGRPMKEYVVLPPGVLADKAKSKAWVSKSVQYVAAMPAKKAGKGKRKRRSAGDRLSA